MIGKRARRGFYKRKPTQQQLEHQNATTRLTVHSHLTMADPPAARSCTVCRKDSGISCCGRCKSTSYCSKECQKSDWRMHKLLCDSFSKFLVSSRPTPDHIRAVLFDPDEAKPKLLLAALHVIPNRERFLPTSRIRWCHRLETLDYNCTVQRGTEATYCEHHGHRLPRLLLRRRIQIKQERGMYFSVAKCTLVVEYCQSLFVRSILRHPLAERY
jgi:hypothetical protein